MTWLTLSIIACRLSSTDPALITWPFFSSFFSTNSNGSDSPAVFGESVVGFGWDFWGVNVVEEEDGEENVEKRLAAGRRVDEGRWGKGKTGIGGIEDLVEFSDVVGVGSMDFAGGYNNHLN